MSKEFREFLRKVGSGTHTSKSLTRQEAEAATIMMLQGVATPAQIGAFMIAHRIKRPTSEELAGMLDAYKLLGAKVSPMASDKQVLVLGSPYDGRSKTAPVSPVMAIVLAAADVPVLMHGGDRMPTKEGLPFMEIWRALGLNWQDLTIEQVQHNLETQNLGFVYLPKHFPLAQGLVAYREQIGKRPPFATLELMWSPYQGKQFIVSGFVHPPTETNIREAFAQHGIAEFATVKGWEGSVDLPRSRTGIIGINHGDQFERITLSARNYEFSSEDPAIADASEMAAKIISALKAEPSEYLNSVLWNCGFYLWLYGMHDEIADAIVHAQELINSGKALRKLEDLRA
ncbi:anthranilate phosphoribosyltransferase [Pseudanabaena sp. lw0831]|uniref:anthranilate phosphoribosyltransferase family protein n=1 Tax=Pseudanabaena sp. lw0831 TaxID=1357935 RepID=UPI0019164168|nr:anthranilate phosphoribosyltransferase family protein [Pseudanabaena sp. lw0831]GBO54335.1 anthranilate phosphoribosyltransferase [Pseudanabaena sp. lw0831]